ncbi:hypothetical protein GGD41_002967 [Paraburkholderia bryophila]|uniref:Uncharacterized protein n=1 Tax=Paraburkholderia bryophila TaxID=420952 RepID=A0A7Z0AZK2_9BURK|nr:hypothetical protein [Paraburkholderia bryophila]
MLRGKRLDLARQELHDRRHIRRQPNESADAAGVIAHLHGNVVEFMQCAVRQRDQPLTGSSRHHAFVGAP